MASTTLHTPIVHHVFNELDAAGLLLGLKRLPGEANREYKQRLLDVMVHRSGSTYFGLLFGMTRELGLSIEPALQLDAVKSGDAFVVPEPAIVFSDTDCIIYNDYSNNDIALTIDRMDSTADTFLVSGLINAINATGVFTATALDIPVGVRSMCIYSQNTISTVLSEGIRVHGTSIALNEANVIANSLTIFSNRLLRRVADLGSMERPGDYVLDPSSGNITTNRSPGGNDIAFYKYIAESVKVSWSPIILHSLQSEAVQEYMFEQLTDEEGNPVNGLPTYLGADIINELMSVFPAGWGR